MPPAPSLTKYPRSILAGLSTNQTGILLLQPLTQAECGHQGQTPAKNVPSLKCPNAVLGKKEIVKIRINPCMPVPMTTPSPDAGPSAHLSVSNLIASPFQCGAIQPLPVRSEAILLQPHMKDISVSCAQQESLAQERTHMSLLGAHPAQPHS